MTSQRPTATMVGVVKTCLQKVGARCPCQVSLACHNHQRGQKSAAREIEPQHEITQRRDLCLGDGVRLYAE